MSSITTYDMLRCASNTLMYCDDIHPPVSTTSISEKELVCGERIVPEYPIAEHVPPTMVHVQDRLLLAFDTMDTTPLCLKPLTKGRRTSPCDEREDHVAYARTKTMISSTKAPRRDEEWLSWVNWDQAA